MPAPQTVRRQDVQVAVEGGVIPAKLYLPEATTSGTSLLWLHGGGFVGGGLRMAESDAVARAFAAAGVTTLSAGYRLVPPVPRARRWRGAPAVRFPVPVDDCLAAWSVLARSSSAAGEHLFVGGASAGGNLAVMSVLRAAGAGLAPPAGVLLAYPLLHAALPSSGDRGGLTDRFTSGAMGWMARSFVGAAHTDRLPEAFPDRQSLAGFPRTVIVTGDRDGLRPSGEAFADDLARAGVDVTISAEPGTGHGHLNSPDRPSFTRTMTALTDWVRAH